MTIKIERSPKEFVPLSVSEDIARQRVLDARRALGLQNAARFHGLRHVLTALGLDKPERRFDGKRVLITGHLPGRLHAHEQIEERGGQAVTVDLGTLANPMTRSSLDRTLAKRGAYDAVASYMDPAFYNAKSLKDTLAKRIRSVRFSENPDASFSSTTMDFSPMFAYAEANPESEVAALTGTMNRFFKAGKLDPFAGAKMLDATNEVIRGKKGLEARDEVDQRPAGNTDWDELRDIAEMLYEQAGDALTGLWKSPAFVERETKQQMKLVRAELREHIKKIDAILDMPQENRPVTMPPAIHTVTVRMRREAPSDIKVFV